MLPIMKFDLGATVHPNFPLLGMARLTRRNVIVLVFSGLVLHWKQFVVVERDDAGSSRDYSK